ncbi:MAG: tRNA pseudouridine(55) synthase TruB [SAR202 cluster bacterium]|nr:tRNA pseudouridine(55) synthase TruB [SAR202 cluster bacterium]
MNNPAPTLNGFLLINKARGMTSMDVVRRVKRLVNMRKRVGHGGTLDPLAEGILPVCLGQATRLMEILINDTKEYRMTVRLGIATDTYDADGIPTEVKDASAITRDQVEKALDAFRGVFMQMPPMHSALKKEGRRLYEFAREGIEVERQPREVEVTRLTIVEFNPPDLVIEAECGRGLYMRSLAHDLGQALGCGGHVSVLLRLRTGPFHVRHAMTLDDLTQASSQRPWNEILRPIDSMLLNMPAAVVDKPAERHLRNGQGIALGADALYASHLESRRLYTADGKFLALVRFDRPTGKWEPFKVFSLEESSPFAPQSHPV